MRNHQPSGAQVRVSAFLFCFAIVMPARGQTEAVPMRAPRQAPAAVPQARPALEALPLAEFALDAAKPEDLQKIDHKPNAIGITRALPPEAVRRGMCELSPDGSQIWRLSLRSPGAAGLRLHFKEFSIGKGEVWIYGASRTDHLFGPYTGEGIFEDGDYWTNLISGDAANIEYRAEPGAQCPRDPLFEIPELAHIVRAIPATEAGSASGSLIAPPENPLEKFSIAPRNAVSACAQSDVSCFPAWQTAADSVARITYSDGQFQYLCTGSLLGTRAGRNAPYFLTANHCTADADPRTFLFLWFYQSKMCNDPPPLFPTLRQTAQTMGATVLSSRPTTGGDYALLLMSQPPPAGATFAGWSPSELTAAQAVVGIHHPNGDFKKISFGNRSADESVNTDIGFFPASQSYRVAWTTLGTEGGSSGSPIYAAASPGVLYGTLTSGRGVNCDFNSGYGRFSVAYPDLRTYLEDGACTFTSSEIDTSAPSSGATRSISVTTQANCGWEARGNGLSVASGGGIGSGGVGLTISANTTSLPRPLSATVAGRRYVLAQKTAAFLQPYADIPQSHPYADYINLLASKGIVSSGCSSGSWCGDATTTRAQMAEFVIKALFPSGFTYPASPTFLDVPSTRAEFSYVQKMRELGITVGCTSTTYCPDNPVNRQQMAAFLIRGWLIRNGGTSNDTFAYNPTPYFTDSKPGIDPYFTQTQKMKELGITVGCTVTEYCPGNPTTRGQMGVFLVRTFLAP